MAKRVTRFPKTPAGEPAKAKNSITVTHVCGHQATYQQWENSPVNPGRWEGFLCFDCQQGQVSKGGRR